MAGKRSSGKRNSVSAGKTPEKSENELKNSKNSDRRRSKRLAVFIQNSYNVVSCLLCNLYTSVLLYWTEYEHCALP